MSALAGAALAGHPWRAGYFVGLLVLLALAVGSLRWLAARNEKSPAMRFGTPLLFGLWVLLFWELLVVGFEVPKVLMPAPSVVWESLIDGAPALRGDFVQTVLHSVLIGLAIGCGLGFRISTEAARLNMGLVWAAIAVAAVAGSALYALIEWIERRLTFWHPSIRMG